jgi:hypothetical protein
MLASETAPISYPGVAFEDEVAEPCFTNFGKLVEKARMVGQAYERHRCLGLSLDTMSGAPVLASGGATPVGGSNGQEQRKKGQAETSAGTEPSQVWIVLTRLRCRYFPVG